MQLDALLEVAVGLVFTWLVLSVATMHIQDRIGSYLEWRANFLQEAILNMVKDRSMLEQLYAHPLIQALSQTDRKGRVKRPTSIPNTAFATALLEVIMNAGRPGREIPIGSMSIQQMRESVRKLKEENPELGRTIERVLPGLDSEGLALEDTIAKYHKNVEDWFDTVMNQASEWYKSHAQTWAFIIGLALAVIFNIDTLNITNQLWREPTLRAVIVAQAQNQSQVGQPQITNISENFEKLAIPVGWTSVPLEVSSACKWPPKAENKPAYWSVDHQCREMSNLPQWGSLWGWIVKVFGFVVSGVAAMQGAPFWFDVLRKVIGFRSQVQNPPSQPQSPTPPSTLPAPVPSQAPEPPSGVKPAG